MVEELSDSAHRSFAKARRPLVPVDRDPVDVALDEGELKAVDDVFGALEDADDVRLLEARRGPRIWRWGKGPLAPLGSLASTKCADPYERARRAFKTGVSYDVVLWFATEIGEQAFEISVSGSANLSGQRRPCRRVVGRSDQSSVPSVGFVAGDEADFPECGKRVTRKPERRVLAGTWMAFDLQESLAQIVLRPASHDQTATSN